MTYSTLIDQTKPPKKQSYGNKYSSRSGTKVSRVIVHHWAGTSGGVERLVTSADKASANYIILKDGTLIGSVPEEYRAWTSGSATADRPSITVEVQNSTGGPEWRVSAASIDTLTKLIADVATRYNFTPSRTTVRGHREFDSTDCPGPDLYPRLSQIAEAAAALMKGCTATFEAKPTTTASTAKKNSNAHRAYAAGEVLAVQKKLTAAGFYGGLLDDDYGPATESAVRSYQAAQLYGSLVADGDWGPTTEAHYQWVIALQTALNEWKSSYADLVVDGSYGSLTARRVRDVQTRNKTGAYKQAGGSVADGVPGPVTCSMLNIPTHP